MTTPEPIPFKPDWPIPEERFLRSEMPPPPSLPLTEVFGERWACWIRDAAEAKSSPADYVAAALLAVSGSLIGNTRWVSPWQGWSEPPIIWSMAIGNPSMNKSPGLDAVLTTLKKVEREEREKVMSVLSECRERAEVAKLAEQAWKEAARAALKVGEDVPPKPEEATAEPEPNWLRLAVNDATVEKLAVIISRQPRGTLLARDELSGWLQNMVRYSGGSSDRPFWLEAYGGRGFTVERMGRDPVYIDRLSIGVVGGIQPDKLKSLLFKSDDDGLLARLLPVWPERAAIRRPKAIEDQEFLETALRRLLGLQMPRDENDIERPWFVHFTEDARQLLDEFRRAARAWEDESEGLLLSFVGKLPGLAVRLSLILAFLDWVVGGDEEPMEIGVEHFGRAAHFVETYVLPMARRAYADDAAPKHEKSARRLCVIIMEKGWQVFSSRDVMRLEKSGLRTKGELDPALLALEEAGILRPIDQPAGPQGGRPVRQFSVNPKIWRRS